VNNFSELMTAIALLLRQPEQIALQANAGQTWLLANQGQVLTNYLQALEPHNAVS
jgi:hypothetical protein